MPRTAITKSRIVPRFLNGSTFFNGNSAYINVPHNANQLLTGGLTISAWIKARSYGGTSVGRIVDKSSSSAVANGFSLYIDSNPGCFSFSVNGGTTIKSNTGSVTFGKWQHIIVTATSAGLVTYYVNGSVSGTPASTNALSGITTTNDLRIGDRSASTDRYFDGNISEVKIFNSAITASQAQELYATGSVSGVTPVASYALDDKPPTYIDSISGNNGTGTATTYSTDTPVQQRVVVSDDKASLSYSSISTYIDIGTAFSVANRTAFTVCTIVYIGSNANQDIVTQRRSGNGYLGAWRLTVLNNKFEFYGFSTGGGEILNCVSNLTVVPGRWYTLAAVFDPVALTAKLFINGLLDKSVPVAGTGNFDNTIAIGIGKNFRDGNNPLIGKMAKFYMWNGESLTNAEVAAIHFNRTIKTSQYLKCRYEHTEGAGTIAYDSSGNGNNGTITGATWSSDTPSKARTVVGGNLVKNGDFSYVPVGTVATNTFGKFINGTAAGDTVNIFGWALLEKDVDGSSLFTETGVLKVSNISTNANAAAGITPSNSAANIVKYGIKLTPGVSYTLSGRVKTSLTSGAATTGARLFANIYNATGSYQTTKFAVSSITTTTDWTTYSTTFTPSTSQLIAIVYLNVKGNDGAATLIMDAWFDDISLTKTTPQTRTVV